MAAPLKNNNYNLEITGMTHEGQGVGKSDGFAVFIDGALLGETVETKIIKVNATYAIGKLLQVIEPSPHRLLPFCPVFDKCGGCSLQHMNYPAQLEFKTTLVKDSLKRIGKLEQVAVHPTLGMEKPQNYRNKAQYPVGTELDQPVIGFYAKRSHRIIETEACGIQDTLSQKIQALVHTFIIDHKLSAYNEEKGNGLIRHVMTRVGFKSGEVMVVLVINGKDLPTKDALIKVLRAEIPGLKSVYLNINTQNTNIILGEKNIKIFGSDHITDTIGTLKFNISPLSFYQVNPPQTEILYSKAVEYAGLSGTETVFDLYCGVGTISLFLSQKAKKVYGVEVVEAAILDARENARINGIENIEFLTGEAEKVIPDIYAHGVHADVVVVDPPRKGCDPALLETLVKMQPQRIVYVSCNPSTLARDLSYLSENGYSTVEVQPVDMFPHTAHVECCALIEKGGT